jgi:tetratricopeptide (TPR) repeat protein
MMSVSRYPLVAALALGGSAVLLTDAAEAQRAPRGRQQPAQPTVQAQGRALNISPAERTVLVPLDAAARGTDRAAQDAALAAAQPVVRSADARYAFARYQMTIALQRNDNAMLSRAVDMAIDSGVAPAEEMPAFLTSQATLAQEERNFQKAERALTRLAELRPGNVEVQAQLAQLRVDQGRVNEGLRALLAAIAAQQAAGQPAPQNWFHYGLRHAVDSRDPAVRAHFLPFARGLLAAYPTPANWRHILVNYRERAQPDAQANLDLSRLMLAAGALGGERDYFDFASALNQGGYPAEAKAVLDEGVRARMVDASKPAFRELLTSVNGRIPADRADLPASQRSALAAATGTPALRTADAFLGYGRYPEALALYAAALQKGGVDANLVNTRIGIAHALAGQRSEAETAFRLVTGPRAEIAALWMLWLQRR